MSSGPVFTAASGTTVQQLGMHVPDAHKLTAASHACACLIASAPDVFHTPVTWMPQVHVAVRLGGATALLRWQVLPKIALVDPCVAAPVLVRPVLMLARAVAGTAGR